ncbi:MAG: YqeG family HAD IIIA-type phosphatase [Oscillospiraceae bacterium]|jgi:HAD superfamily phosphatase (TIGR01668 family)|nr:YqeG family HAD IIIA-type phosphatase [Oscillospiraceae bacterium]
MLSFLPDFIFDAVTQISPSFLRARGVALLLLDFDNTLLPYTENAPSRALLAWIEELQSFGIKLCIVSNSHKERVPQFCRKYAIDCVTHAAKPGTKGVNKAISQFKVSKTQTALAGDQIYTDILAAKRAGITAIAVKSIHNHTILLKLRHLLELPFLAMARNRRVKI